MEPNNNVSAEGAEGPRNEEVEGQRQVVRGRARGVVDRARRIVGVQDPGNGVGGRQQSLEAPGGGDSRPGTSGGGESEGSVGSPQRAPTLRRWLNNRDWIPDPQLYQQQRTTELRRGYRQPPSSPAVGVPVAVDRVIQYFGAALGSEDGGGGLPAPVDEAGNSLRRLNLLHSQDPSEGSQNNLNVGGASSSRPPNEANMNVSGERDKCAGKQTIGTGEKKLNTAPEPKFVGADEKDLPPGFRWINIEIEKE